MQSGFLSRSVDRLVANARAIRGAPEAILLVVIGGIGICGFGFQHYRERLAKDKPVLVENASRDAHSLYEDNNPIAQVQDPKIDLDQKKVTFVAVNSGYMLQTNKLYEFQNWKLACGGTRLYNMVSDGASPEFSYSPLICKIVGSR